MHYGYEKSLALYDRADCIPGRSNTRSKAPGRLFDVGHGPLYFKRAFGSHIVDVDNNVYIDMICGLGAVSLGHDATPITARRGASSLPHEVEVLAAEHVLRDVAPWATQVRMVRTGSEATHAAYRIAKLATGRPYVLVGDWAYHGWHEWCSDRGPAVLEWLDRDAPLAPGQTALTFTYGFDFRQIHSWLPAAVFIEPHRWEQTDLTWLLSLRAWCDKYGVLLVYDEMIYGGRWAVGGATEYFGVRPDLACYGKAFGNGAPVAFVVGRDVLAAYGEQISGTYSGDTHALTALMETLRYYRHNDVIAHLWMRGGELRDGLENVVQAAGLSDRVFVEGAGLPHQRLRFDASLDADGKAFALAFAGQMASRGVLWHPMLANICHAHTSEEIALVVTAAADSLKALL